MPDKHNYALLWQINCCSRVVELYEPLKSVGWAAATQAMPGPLAESIVRFALWQWENNYVIERIESASCPRMAGYIWRHYHFSRHNVHH